MIKIRSAREDDFDLLKNMYLTEIESHDERANVFAQDLLSLMRTILAFDDNTLCGTVSWAIRGGMDDGVIEIIGLGVNDRYKRKGIATRLVNQAIADAKERFQTKKHTLRRAFLFMEESNHIARQFYLKYGFSEVAMIPKFYPEDGASIFVIEL